MTDNEKIRSTLSKKVKKTKDSFHTAYNKHTIYMYIVVALVLTFIVEMIAGIAAFEDVWSLFSYRFSICVHM